MAIAPLMGVCSSALQYDITDDGRVTGIRFAGGCPGNLEAVARLAEGLNEERSGEGGGNLFKGSLPPPSKLFPFLLNPLMVFFP